MQDIGIPDFLEKRFSKAPDFIYRRVADECLLLPIRRQVADFNYIYVLNPISERIWVLIDGQRRMREIRDQLLAEFEVSPSELEQDLFEFMTQLMEAGGIREG